MVRAIDLDCQVTPCDGVVSCDLADEVVLLHLPSGTYFGLDAIGMDIWNCIQQARTVGEVSSYLRRSYDVTQEQCEASLFRLLQQMAEHGLVIITQNVAAQ